jgi:hypothetical protein
LKGEVSFVDEGLKEQGKGTSFWRIKNRIEEKKNAFSSSYVWFVEFVKRLVFCLKTVSFRLLILSERASIGRYV